MDENYKIWICSDIEGNGITLEDDNEKVVGWIEQKAYKALRELITIEVWDEIMQDRDKFLDELEQHIMKDYAKEQE